MDVGHEAGHKKSVVWQVGGKIKEISRSRINILQWGYILSCLSHRWSLKIHTFIHVGERFKKERKTFTFDSTHDDERDNDERLVRVEVVYLPSATGEEAPPRAHPTSDDHLKSFNGDDHRRQDYSFH